METLNEKKSKIEKKRKIKEYLPSKGIYFNYWLEKVVNIEDGNILKRKDQWDMRYEIWDMRVRERNDGKKR